MRAWARMDEVLIANFMIFQDAIDEGGYDLVIADEAWDVDHYWHEHPELKKAKLAWFTDFVGYLPMVAGGGHEAFLATDYNAEMIEHVDLHGLSLNRWAVGAVVDQKQRRRHRFFKRISPD